ncbi:uncharacterized protein LOC113005831 isoform X2 [Solenopsis invicta]|uniref:uncharacterized protein LOC113005831 isoform X2 n=1 Tax=Solenopsis invicta TaxID=13686 RepID=UPI00193EB1A9|nr:uncharacterized protein LOC113005831 isoform X2 [Solenopsis invicta]
MEEAQVHVQVKDNSIECILRPISYTSWFLGVGVARPRKDLENITIIIRIIHMAMCFFITIYNAKYFFTHTFLFGDRKIIMYTNFVNMMINYISAYYNIYHGIRHCKIRSWQKLMNDLEELDQNIRKKTSINDESIKFDDRCIKIVEALAIFMTFTFPSLWLIVQILLAYILPYQHEYFITQMLFYSILAQSLINSFVFDIVVYVLYRRFQTLNELIGTLHMLDVKEIVSKIRLIRKLHGDICKLAEMVNDMHSLHLLFCSANCFVTAVAALLNLYIILNSEKTLLLLMYPVLQIVYVMQFYLICWICTLACKEFKRTGSIIHKISLKCQPVRLDNHKASNQSNPEVRDSTEDSNGEQNSNCSSSHNQYDKNEDLKCVGIEKRNSSIPLKCFTVKPDNHEASNQSNPEVRRSTEDSNGEQNSNCSSSYNQYDKNEDLKCVGIEVRDFSNQLQNQIAFTACDFFEINKTLFSGFVGYHCY